MKRILFFITAFMIMSSCEYEFDGFPDDLLCWIPYDIGDSLLYTDETDTIVFEVEDFYKTGSDSFRGLAMDVEWYFEGYYLTKELENGYLIEEKYDNDGDSKADIFSVNISNYDVFTFSFWGDYYSSNSSSISIEYFEDTIIANKKYYEVYRISKTSLKFSERINWIIKAKDKGVVQFFDSKTNKKWQLIN